MKKEKEIIEEETSLNSLHDLLEADNRNMKRRTTKPFYKQITDNPEQANKVISELSSFAETFDKPDVKGRRFCFVNADNFAKIWEQGNIIISPVLNKGEVDNGRTGAKINNSIELLGSDMFWGWRKSLGMFKVYQHYTRTVREK